MDITRSMQPAQGQKLAVSTHEAAHLAGVGRTTIYEAIQSGDLKSLKIGKRRLIRIDALQAWLAALEAAS